MLQSWISILSGLSLIISAMISTVQPNILFCIDMAVGLIVTVAGYRYACKSGSNETCTVPVQYSILTGVWLMISALLGLFIDNYLYLLVNNFIVAIILSFIGVFSIVAQAGEVEYRQVSNFVKTGRLKFENFK